MMGMIAFAAFEVWLLAFPLDGFLLRGLTGGAGLHAFLPSLILGLLAGGRFLSRRTLARVGNAGIALSMLLTLGFALAPSGHAYLLAALGLTSAPLVLKAFALLRDSGSPLRDAAAGILLGNLLLWGLMAVPLALPVKLLLVTLALLAPLTTPLRPSGQLATPFPRHYLLFILIFQVLGGLMYGRLLPAYQQVAMLPGSELLFYCAAIGGAYLLAARGDKDLLVPAGVTLGIVAFSLLNGQPGIGENLGMYAMQGANGFIDLFSAAVILDAGDAIGRAGDVMGVTYLGILAGDLFSTSFTRAPSADLLVAHLVLPISMVVLYLGSRRSPPPATTEQPPVAGDRRPGIPDDLARRLAPQEQLVLQEVLAGKSFTGVAQQIGISTSSVKTYMRRIYQKAGIDNREQLFALLTQDNGEKASRSDQPTPRPQPPPA